VSSADPYLDPTSGALLNKLGVPDARLLAQIEAETAFLRDAELKRTILPGRFDLAHLRAFHRRLFGDVYPWAGEIRTVDIGKSTYFAHWRHIEPYAEHVLGVLKDEHHLAGVDREDFLDRFAHYFAEVNALHPFREGNGRTQRAFFRQLALHAGWRVDFALLDPAEYNEACRLSLGSPDTLRGLFASILTPA
jgi:cell filamentation protein